MGRLPLKRLLLLPLAVLALSPLASLAQEEEAPKTVQPWSLVLREQLQREKDCVVNEILTVNEFKVGDETMLEGRVSCIDGRQFDFNRRHEHVKFDLRICDPILC